MDNSSHTQQNVATMSNYRPHSGFAPLSIVEAYWDALRAGREMPKRAEINPRGIESALEYAFILERVAHGVARMRIAGSHLHDLMGMEARGMPLTAFFEHDYRVQVAGLLEEVFQTPAAADVLMTSSSSLGRPALEAWIVLLPLKSDLGDVSRILGCMVSKGDLAEAPRRFKLADSTLRRLDGKVEPAGKPVVREFAEPAKSFEAKLPEASNSKRPAYLRLIKNDD